MVFKEHWKRIKSVFLWKTENFLYSVWVAKIYHFGPSHQPWTYCFFASPHEAAICSVWSLQHARFELCCFFWQLEFRKMPAVVGGRSPVEEEVLRTREVSLKMLTVWILSRGEKHRELKAGACASVTVECPPLKGIFYHWFLFCLTGLRCRLF